MPQLAIIGGTGFDTLNELKNVRKEMVETPFGQASCEYTIGEIDDIEVIFLPRHAANHSIPPHKINYRANIWGLHDLDTTHIISIASVGGIHKEIAPEKIIIPNQIIDYTYGRKHTFFDENLAKAVHVDFTHPYCAELRNLLIESAKKAGIDVRLSGTYAATQGPRLETAAEIKRLKNDGCDIVGMTGMPEAALAKELDICYATCALCVNWAAGLSEKKITMEDIKQTLDSGLGSVMQIVRNSIKLFRNL